MSLRRIKGSDMRKFLDRGPREFKSHKTKKKGDVMIVAEKGVMTTHPRNSIKNVARLMQDNDFRRIPITNAGTGRLEGLAVAIDILDFLGGGEKYNIILEDYGANFLSAINCPIHKIARKAEFLDENSKMEEVIDIMLKKRTSAIPIVNNERERKVRGIVTETDVLPTGDEFGILVEEVMQREPIVSSLGMMISDVSKIMVRNKYRRLPVTRENKLMGIVTVFDILKFLGYGEFKGSNPEKILSKRVEEVMKKDVITAKPEQDLAEISTLIKETGRGGFPVVEDEKLIGLVTTSDVIRGIYGEKR